jgi:hypothetical protein
MNSYEFLVKHNQLLTAARDLVRANKRNVDTRPFFSIVEKTVAAFSATEFEDWCEDVDRVVQALLADRAISLDHWQRWDYSKYYNEGLTTIEAADRLLNYLLGSLSYPDSEPTSTHLYQEAACESDDCHCQTKYLKFDD